MNIFMKKKKISGIQLYRNAYCELLFNEQLYLLDQD